MTKKTAAILLFLSSFLVLISLSVNAEVNPKEVPAQQSQKLSAVEKHGQLQVKGNRLYNQNGKVVQLRGMSLFWSQWMYKYYNANTISWLVKEWNCDIIRAAIAIESGYMLNPEAELAKIDAVVKAAVAEGIYVIIDYHSHKAAEDVDTAVDFFDRVSKLYADVPNVIYEIYNEPLDYDWKTQLLPYAQKVSAAIRANDPDNLILCGTRTWSQRVDEVIEQPLEDNNTAYVLHFYAGTHKKGLRNIGDKAMNNGLCLFVSEFGVVNANGDGAVAYKETQKWMEWMDENQISWCNWAVSDKKEGASILKPGTSANETPALSDLTEAGLYLRKMLVNKEYGKP